MIPVNRSIYYTLLGLSLLLYGACKKDVVEKPEISKAELLEQETPPEKRVVSNEFSKYWYRGKAEITSYELEQARYGELRKGDAVLVFVTEDFLPEIQVKADRPGANNIPVLKLNKTKKFLTGIYPYSIMTSTFYPVKKKQHALKVSNSVQEWCGHVYAQLNNRRKFELTAHSYFQGEADQQLLLDKTYLEDEIWTLIRINPDELPLGALDLIPSMEFLRLKHKEFKAYKATATLTKKGGTSIYRIDYPQLNRSLSVAFASAFPYSIESWEETMVSGFGTSAQTLTTRAVKKRQIMSAYWQKNSNDDVHLRDSLGI